MQRFELIEGTSSKFWEVSRDGSTYSVRYGRIGTNGQTLSKTAVSDAKAQAEVDKLIKEKTGKGYSEVASAAGSIPAVLASTSSKPSTPSVAKSAGKSVVAPTAAADISNASDAPASMVAPSRPAPSKPSAEVGDLRQPSGEFQFSSAWRKALPSQRGFPAHGAPPALPALWLSLAGFVNQEDRQSHWAIKGAGLAAVLKQNPLDHLFSETSLTEADPQRWLVALQLGCVVQNENYDNAQCLLIQLAVQLHGVAFATECYLAAMTQMPSGSHVNWYYNGRLSIDALNAALASCSESDYAQATAIARAKVPSAAIDRFLRGAVFNSEATLVAEALEVADFNNGYARISASGLAGVSLTLTQAQALVEAPASRGNPTSTILALNLVRAHAAAALPLVARLYDLVDDSQLRQRLAEILRGFDSNEAFVELLGRIEHKEARAQIDDFARAYPFAAMRAALTFIARSRSKSAEAWLSRMLAAYPALLALLRDDTVGAASDVLDRLCSKLIDLDEAPLDALPTVLSDPPWLKPQPKRVRPTLPDVAMPAARLQWPDGLREDWSRRLPANDSADPDSNKQKGRMGEALEQLSIPRDLWPALLSGEIADLSPHLAAIESHRGSRPAYHRYRYLRSLTSLAPRFRLLLWNSLSGWDGYTWEGSPTAGSLIAHYELAALPGLLNFLESRLEHGLIAALPVAAPEVAAFAAKGLLGKKSRPHAAAWLRAHAELASTALLVQCASGAKQVIANAEAALRWLAANVEPARLIEGARHFGAAGEALLEAITAVDPLSLLPQKPRPLANFFLPGGFARPRLTDGRALPAEVLPALGTMLQVSLLDEAYTGLDQVKSACNAASLDEFAWDLFQAWYQNGAPSKESWGFTAMGLIGGDGCVRQLTPLIREWPGESQHARAVLGLDILAAIGSDLALMNLNGIAQKAKFKGLQDRARDRIQAIAEARDLSTEELADRLVPDLDLDANGTLLLDFGHRRFTVGFDEQLRPFVLDANGARLKDLPKPNKADDGELAPAASERWKLLKKDVKAIANNQIQRLELAMCSGRSFDASVFRQFFVQHPLMRHLVRRLLWGVPQADGSVLGFRVAEDLSFADHEDMQFELAEDATVCLPHVLMLGEAQQAAFGQVFADYEILQPFVQLGREILTMSEDELGQFESSRFKGKRVAIGSVYGLQHRGWRHGSPQDGGWIGWFEKSLPGGLEVQLELEPGTVVGEINYEPKQTLGALSLRIANSWDDAGRRCFRELDAVARSELLRDLDRLSVLVE
ncbi:MAG: WGR and DUF4132 domain-containing protein [Pseudomarimonas sp.]